MWTLIKYVGIFILGAIAIIECLRACRLDEENIEIWQENKQLKKELKAYQDVLGPLKPFEEFETTER